MVCRMCNGTGIIEGKHITAKCIQCFGSGHEREQPIIIKDLVKNMTNPYY